LGADNVVATTGGRASETQIADAKKRGVEKFTLLFDNDERGRSFVIPTIKAIQEAGGSIYIASLPDGAKDLDEYLAAHTIEDYRRNVVGEALSYSTYLLNDIVRRYSEREDKEGLLTLKDREDFFSDVERLLNSPYIKPYEREDIYKLLEQYEESLNFKVKDFREWADKAYLRTQEANRAKAVKEASTKITEALSDGRTDEALSLMRETATKQSAQERAVEYAQVFAPSTPQEYATFLSEIKEGIPTGYLFEQGKQREELTLNSGLTFICGYRGHGKTSFLNNIALNEARRNVALGNGKSVLYFSYEVDKRRLITDLLNTFVNDADISRTPSDTILSYFKGKGSTYFRNERRTDGRTHYENFVTQKDKFFRELLSSGALTIVDENYRVEKLLDAIKYYLSTRTASIVCIDYAQLIYSEEYSRQRTEEIKKVVNDIKDFANREGIPFVLAAQFNREVDSPISVDTKNIGEGGDFERIADTCIGLFNLKELHPLPKNKDEEKAAKKLLSDLGAATYAQGEELKPIQGKLFVRLMKRRYGYYPLDTILEWEGRTKYIKPNFEEALSTQAQQTELFSETQEDAPF
jgi:replicative DNA helicase